MMICMDADFFFLLLENLCERGGGRKLIQIEVFRHFDDIIGFKVTRPSYFERVPSYFEALWYPHLCFDRKSNI